MTKRKTELTFFNVILCMLVVFIHLISQPISMLDIDSSLYIVYMSLWRMSTFVVQAFVFLSGVKTFFNGREEQYVFFLLKRLKGIVIPYIIAVLVYYMYFVFVLKYFPFNVKDCAGYIIRGDISAQFYFIILIVQMYLLYPLWNFLLNKVKPIYAVSLSAAVNIICGFYAVFIIDRITGGGAFKYIDRLFTTYIIYWVGGIFAGKYYDKFVYFIKKKSMILYILFFVFAVIDVSSFLFYRYGIIKPLHLDMIHSLYCASAILVGLNVSYKLKKYKNSFLFTMDKSSYYIYLYHVLFIFILDNNILIHTNIGSLTLNFLIRSVIIYACCIAFAYIRNIKYMQTEKPQKSL